MSKETGPPPNPEPQSRGIPVGFLRFLIILTDSVCFVDRILKNTMTFPSFSLLVSETALHTYMTAQSLTTSPRAFNQREDPAEWEKASP